MAKDYFEDIVPPQGSAANRPEQNTNQGARSVVVKSHSEPIDSSADVDVQEPEMDMSGHSAPMANTSERSIRNISAPRSRPRPLRDSREAMPVGMAESHEPRKIRWWIWAAATASVLVLGTLLFVSMRQTVITVVPRSHPVTFDGTYTFTAYPTSNSATGTLEYTVQSVDIEDSQVVPSQGTVHAEDKASGSIVVYNDYQTAPLKLIKNTRFQTPDGLIFRAPAEIVIPGKNGSTPGQVTVSVFADAAGEQYNVPAGNFTVPGLTNSAMHSGIYAKSSASMTGGFVGDKPGVAPAALESAVAEVRSRLEKKARESLQSTSALTIFADLIRISYSDLPSTSEAGGGVRIHQKAHVEAPAFDPNLLANQVAQSVSADAGDSSVLLKFADGFSVKETGTPSVLGVDSLQFAFTGSAQLVWNVDSTALTQSLLGRNQDAFETIVGTFPSIQEAHARIEPFWSGTFPKDKNKIKVEIQSVEAK